MQLGIKDYSSESVSLGVLLNFRSLITLVGREPDTMMANLKPFILFVLQPEVPVAGIRRFCPLHWLVELDYDFHNFDFDKSDDIMT